jgi:hypothetical protein
MLAACTPQQYDKTFWYVNHLCLQMFIKYYDTVMPLLLNILVNANDKVSLSPSSVYFGCGAVLSCRMPGVCCSERRQ